MSARTSMPWVRLTDRRFRYVPSYATDVRRTFRKARLLQRLQAAKAVP